MTRVVCSSSLALTCLFLFACSEGPGVLPRGGANFTTGSTTGTPSGKNCPTFGYSVEIGDPPPNRHRNEEGGTLADGESGTTVSCVARGTEDITFDVRIRGRNHDGREGEIRLRNGTMNAAGIGTANATVNTPPDTHSAPITLTSEEPCEVTGVETSAGNQYGDGKFWARFYCSAMTGGLNHYCKTEGVVVFEYCDR